MTDESLDIDSAISQIAAIKDSQEQPLEREEEQEPTEEPLDEEPEDGQSEEEDEDGAEEEPQKYKVKVDGQEIEVSLDDLLQGYSRTQDYHKKTERLARERDEVEAYKDNLTQWQSVAQEYTNRTELLEKAFASLIPPEPDFALIQANPTAYQKAKLAREHALENLSRLQAGRQQEQERLNALQAQEVQALTAREARLLMERAPELQSQESKQGLAKWLNAQGFSEEEITNARDHRVFLMALKAKKYDDIMSSKTAPEVKKSPPLKSKSAPISAASVGERKRQEALAMHQKTRTVDSAVSALAAIMSRSN